MEDYYSYPTPNSSSSTHSSPRTYPTDLDYSQSSAPVSVHSYLPRKAHTFPNARPLQVSTAVESDPSEATARPSNAHVHAQFHSQSLPVPTPPQSDSQYQSSPDPSPENDSHQLYSEEFSQATSLGLSKGLSRPLTPEEIERLAHLDRLKFFLATAPTHWNEQQQQCADLNGPSSFSHPSRPVHVSTPTNPHPAMYRFPLPSQEFISCVLWGNLFHITGTDIVRALVFRFEAFGRPVRNAKKFEEGVFSDLRNLKPGQDATLEEPKSAFLDLLFRHQSIRTQKKQKVFYWFSVPHDRLFLDALERDLKREKMGLEPTTRVEGEPAISFVYDRTRGLYEQFCGNNSNRDGEDDGDDENIEGVSGDPTSDTNGSEVADGGGGGASGGIGPNKPPSKKNSLPQTQTPYFAMFSLFEGSPTYKQRRKKTARAHSNLSMASAVFPPGQYDDVRGRAQGRTVGGFDHRSASLSAHGDGRAKQYNPMNAADMFRIQARGEFGVKQEDSPWDGAPSPSPSPYPPPGQVFPGSTVHQCPLLLCNSMFKTPQLLLKHYAQHDRPASSMGDAGFLGGEADLITTGLNAIGGAARLEACQIQLSEIAVEVPGGEDGQLVYASTMSNQRSSGPIPGQESEQMVYYDPSSFDNGPPSSDMSGSEYEYDLGRYPDRWALDSAPASRSQSFNGHQISPEMRAMYANNSSFATDAGFSQGSYPNGSYPPSFDTSAVSPPTAAVPLIRSSSVSSLNGGDQGYLHNSSYQLGLDSNSYMSPSMHISSSAPSYKQTFDHDMLARASMSRHSHSPMPNAHSSGMTAIPRPPSFHSASYPSHYQPSSSPSISASPSTSTSSLLDNTSGIARRHRSMTPSIARAENAGISLNMSGRRPMTAHSSSSDFSPSMQMQQQQNTVRGRGYHPYAGGYSTRSTSSASGSSARSSPRPSPGMYSVPLGSVEGNTMAQGMMGLDLSSAMGNEEYSGGLGVYRTDSPGSMGYGQPPQQQNGVGGGRNDMGSYAMEMEMELGGDGFARPGSGGYYRQ